LANLDKMKKFPPEMRGKIIAALKANPSASAVARQVGGVSNHTVGRIARQAGIRLAAATGERHQGCSTLFTEGH
jgi:transposase-like protein